MEMPPARSRHPTALRLGTTRGPPQPPNDAAADPWDVILANGADLLEEELADDMDTVFDRMLDYLSLEQVAFIQVLFERKRALPAAAIEVAPELAEWLESTFEDPRAKYREMAELYVRSQEAQPGGAGEPAALDLRCLDSLDTAAEARKAMQESRAMFAELGTFVPPGRSPDEQAKR